MDIQIPTENGNHTLSRRNSGAKFDILTAVRAEDSGLVGCDAVSWVSGTRYCKEM